MKTEINFILVEDGVGLFGLGNTLNDTLLDAKENLPEFANDTTMELLVDSLTEYKFGDNVSSDLYILNSTQHAAVFEEYMDLTTYLCLKYELNKSKFLNSVGL